MFSQLIWLSITHTYTMQSHTHMLVQQTYCFSSSVIAIDYYKGRQTSCERDEGTTLWVMDLYLQYQWQDVVITARSVGLHLTTLLQLLLLLPLFLVLPDMVGFSSVPLQVLHHMLFLGWQSGKWGEERGGARSHIARDGVHNTLISF